MPLFHPLPERHERESAMTTILTQKKPESWRDIPPLDLPRCWIGHMPDGTHRVVEMGANNGFIVTERTLTEYQRRDGDMHVVRYALAQVTPVADSSHVWMTELSAERYDGIL
jgi:hypothetical protein